MEAAELKLRRKALNMTQAEFAKRLGLHRDFVGLMERGEQPIAERTALAITALEADAPSTGVEALPPLVTNDPMEQIVERALQRAKISYVTDQGGHNPSRLDFRLPDYDVEIEVKRMHTDRVADQMARAPNVIVAQGEPAIRFLADLIAAGRFPAS